MISIYLLAQGTFSLQPRIPEMQLQRENRQIIGLLFSGVERLMGVEPTYAAWEAAVLPMNYSRRNVLYYSRPFFILQHEKWRVF